MLLLIIAVVVLILGIILAIRPTYENVGLVGVIVAVCGAVLVILALAGDVQGI